MARVDLYKFDVYEPYKLCGECHSYFSTKLTFHPY